MKKNRIILMIIIFLSFLFISCKNKNATQNLNFHEYDSINKCIDEFAEIFNLYVCDYYNTNSLNDNTFNYITFFTVLNPQIYGTPLEYNEYINKAYYINIKKLENDLYIINYYKLIDNYNTLMYPERIREIIKESTFFDIITVTGGIKDLNNNGVNEVFLYEQNGSSLNIYIYEMCDDNIINLLDDVTYYDNITNELFIESIDIKTKQFVLKGYNIKYVFQWDESLYKYILINREILENFY